MSRRPNGERRSEVQDFWGGADLDRLVRVPPELVSQ